MNVDATALDAPHYRLRLIFWAILIDNWKN